MKLDGQIIKKKLKNNFFKCFYLLLFIGALAFVYLFSCLFFSRILNQKAENVNDKQTILYRLVTNLNNDVNPNKEISQNIELADNKSIKSSINFLIRDNSLVFSSFFDTFANSSLVDLEKTDLYLDPFADGVFFPPLYSFEKIKGNITLSDYDFNKFGDSEADNFYNKRCLGNNCLEFKDKKLLFNKRELEYPLEVRGKNVALVSVGVVEDIWLLGFTIKDSNYSGIVYSFDGKYFKKILDANDFSSPYFGILGFGGSRDDFLVIYGAQKGIAYRVQPQKNTDISEFFDFRMMNKGFHPEVIKIKNNYITNWYIFSLSFGHPTLIKLWQDSNNNIVGKMFYQDVWLSGYDSSAFYPFKNEYEKISLLLKNEKEKNITVEIFNDFGFNKNISGSLFFKPVNLGNKVKIKKIANSLLGTEESPCFEGKWFFSADQKEWIALPQGYYLNQDFNLDGIQEFYLKASLPSSNNKFYSPFLAEVLFDFYYQK